MDSNWFWFIESPMSSSRLSCSRSRKYQIYLLVSQNYRTKVECNIG